MKIEPAQTDDLDAIAALLVDANLPSEDLSGAALAHFFVARAENTPSVVAAAGLEAHAPSGLLRSVVVVSTQRERGLGGSLVDAIEARARDLGIENLVLLTTTAKPFFARRGYTEIAREDAPTTLQATREFATLCPASAVCMQKNLRT